MYISKKQFKKHLINIAYKAMQLKRGELFGEDSIAPDEFVKEYLKNNKLKFKKL